VQQSAEREALAVEKVFDGSGAQAAGIVIGDRVIAVDGLAVTELGLDGAIARIRGAPGTTVGITLRRGEVAVTVLVERRKLKA
jgi:carboxyl-terminal processing protease